MRQTETKQKKIFSNNLYLYTALLVLTFLPLSLVDNIEKNSLGLKITTLLLLVNFFFFVNVRIQKEFFTGKRIFTLLATSISIWFFLHCFLCVNPIVGEIVGENIARVLNLFGFDLNGNIDYAPFSFFVANLFSLVVSLSEIKMSNTDKPVYIILIIYTTFITFLYLILFNSLIIR